MFIKSHKLSEPTNRKSDFIESLLIAETVKGYEAYAQLKNGTTLPIWNGPLNAVIAEAERCSASTGAPVYHSLSRQVFAMCDIEKKVGSRWAWFKRVPVVFPNADEAYLTLRKLDLEHRGPGHLFREIHYVRQTVYACQRSLGPWKTVLFRLANGGELPEGQVKGECQRCFSRFITHQEAGYFCLECGHEHV